MFFRGLFQFVCQKQSVLFAWPEKSPHFAGRFKRAVERGHHKVAEKGKFQNQPFLPFCYQTHWSRIVVIHFHVYTIRVMKLKLYQNDPSMTHAKSKFVRYRPWQRTYGVFPLVSDVISMVCCLLPAWSYPNGWHLSQRLFEESSRISLLQQPPFVIREAIP